MEKKGNNRGRRTEKMEKYYTTTPNSNNFMPNGR